MKLLFDLHTHTVASGHAFSTLKENIEEAAAKELKAMGTSDHYSAMRDLRSLFILLILRRSKRKYWESVFLPVWKPIS